MPSRCFPGLSALIVVLLGSQPASAQNPPKEELVERVRVAIDRAVRHLKQQEAGRGHWEHGIVHFRGGSTCLALLALLNAGVKPEEPVIQRGLDFVRKLEPTHTYVVGLQAMVLAEAGQAKDIPLIERNVKWIINARIKRSGLNGWSYFSGGGGGDNSNTQYALLGLWAGQMVGIKIDPAIWQEIRQFYTSTQTGMGNEGGWGYSPTFRSAPTMTMTVAGLCGLYIADLELSQNTQMLNPETGIAARCGQYDQDTAINRALNWLARDNNFSLTPRSAVYYNLYGLERAGRLSGRRFFGDHDWYREGCEWLTTPGRQADDGSFVGGGAHFDGSPIVSTAFALLFLAKGRTPILISKLAYDAGVRGSEEWNRKHNDVKNIVEYASKELFKRQYLGWQVYDPRLITNLDDARVREEVSALLASPILYMNGHKAPALTDQQIKLVKKYIEEGGFLFAEACCGDPQFDRGFRDLMEQIFPDNPLRPLPPEHPIWSAHSLVSPLDLGNNRLEGIDLGCKTVVVYSPKPISGFWEERRFMPPTGIKEGRRGDASYRLAGNIIAYATGLEIPKPKGFRMKISDEVKNEVVLRGFLKAAQLKHNGDPKPAKNALRNLMRYVREQSGVDVALQEEDLSAASDRLFLHRFLYMHGRNRFTWDKEEVENLRAHLETGGLLLADACCGKKEFDTAFRAFVKELFPNEKFEVVPLDDYLYSEKLNGTAIETVNARRDTADGKADREYQPYKPLLEGVKIDDRWVILYSKYDIGCALDKHRSSDCKGHDHESALKLGLAAVLYMLKK